MGPGIRDEDELTKDATDTRYAIAYQEAVRSLSQQAQGLDSLRTRAGTLIGAASITTSFFSVATNTEDLGVVGLIAGLLFAASALAAILVLFSRRDWIFRNDSRILIEKWIEGSHPVTVTQMHRELADRMESHYEKNKKKIDRLLLFLWIGTGALAAEVIAWTIEVFILGG